MNRNKKLLALGGVIALAAVQAVGIWFVKYRSAERAATQAEIEAHGVYMADWEMEMVLSQCTEREDGYYTSETLAGMLYECEAVEEISLQNEMLHVEYRKNGGGRVVLNYDDRGLREFWVWDAEKDILYHQSEDGASVTTNYYQSLRQRVT